MRNILLMIVMASVGFGQTIHVSPDPAASETVQSLSGAVRQIQQMIQTQEGVQDGVTVLLEPGNYTFSETLRLDSTFRVPAATPIVFKVNGTGKAIFNGGKMLDVRSAELAVDAETVGRLNDNARGKVYRLTVSDPDMQKLLSGADARVSMNGMMMSLSRYPNVGFGHVDKILETGAIYAQGRTLGDRPTYSMDKPVGGVITLCDKDISPWETEFKTVQKARVAGYLAYDWYKQNHRIAAINDGKIKLLEYSRYGILNKEKIPRRLVVTNLLCELDRPGEFYYDDTSGSLLFWPFGDSIKDSSLTLWAGKPFLQMNKAANIRLENIVVEGVSQGNAVFEITDCEDVELAGCVIRNCSRPAVLIKGGRHCGLVSCDIYDVPHHVTLSGGDTKQLVPSGHYAKNCHFTQVQAADFYGKISIEGVGQVFEHNLVHNFIGQVMTVGGNDHRVEYNEFFNIGIEEGDGGTIYSGAAMWSWGNVYRHNFLHHLMCIPQAHPRGGIYPDDRDQGDTITENVFYKAAHRAVLLNGGAGHTVTANLFLDCHIGVYNTDSGAEEMYRMQADYNTGKLKRGDKMDYIWRTEQVIGKEGWNTELWKSRYPMFAAIMNQEQRRFWPIGCTVSGNCFSGTMYNTQFLTKDADGKRLEIPFEKVDYIKARGNREIGMDVFTAPDSLDFSYTSGPDAGRLPDVEFSRIGLYPDRYRTELPDKNRYRAKIRNHFKNRRSYDKDSKYDPTTINDSLYFNTGLLLMGAGID